MNRESKEILKSEVLDRIAKKAKEYCGREIEFALIRRTIPTFDSSPRGVRVLGFIMGAEEEHRYRWELEDEIYQILQETWDQVIQEKKNAGKYPSNLNDACYLAWCEVERIQPFAGYDQISMRGIRSWISNWVLGFPKEMMSSWPDMPKDIETLEDNLPELIGDFVKDLYTTVNASKHSRSKSMETIQPSSRTSWDYFGAKAA